MQQTPLPPENKSNPAEAETQAAGSSLVVGKRAFITALVAIMLNPVSVVVGYLLTRSLQSPKLGVEYVSMNFYHESQLPSKGLLKRVLAHHRLNSQLRLQLEAKAATVQRPACTDWLDGQSLGVECLEDVQLAASALATTLILERDGAKKNIDRIKNGTLDKLGIQPMPLIPPQLIALGPATLAPALKGELADCETMLAVLQPFVEQLKRSLASPLPTGDVDLLVGVLNGGDSDGVVKHLAKLTFGNLKPLRLLAEDYTVVEAHSFQQITFTVGVEGDDLEALDAWKKAVKAGDSLSFEVELESSTKSFSGKGNLKD